MEWMIVIALVFAWIAFDAWNKNRKFKLPPASDWENDPRSTIYKANHNSWDRT